MKARVVSFGNNQSFPSLNIGDEFDVEAYYPKEEYDTIYDAFEIFIEGESSYCLLNDCAWLGGGNWEILNDPD